MSETPVAATTPTSTPESTAISNESSSPVAPPITPVSNKKKYALKIDGQAEEYELDLNDDEAITRHLQMSKAASKRMQEAASTKKQVEQFIHALQNDPLKVLSDPSIMGDEKFQAIAEEFLSRKLRDQMLSPEEKKRVEMEERLRKYEELENQQKSELEQKQTQALEEHYAQQYQQTIIQALEGSDLPKNPFTVRRMAELMQKNLQFGLDLAPMQLAHLVKEDYRQELKSLVGSADANQVLGIFGEELTNKIRKHDLEKLRKQQPVVNRTVTNSAQSENAPPKRMRPDDYEAFLRSK